MRPVGPSVAASNDNDPLVIMSRFRRGVNGAQGEREASVLASEISFACD
jgi:hypothetical protein